MSIGRTLTEARERAGLSVEDVAAATRIRRTLVSSIEQDDFSRCGGDFYARGHLRTIASTVGVDPQPLLAQFDATRPPEPAPRASSRFEPETRPDRSGPNWTAAMAVALVVVLVYGVAQVLSGGGERSVVEGLPGSATSAPAEPGPAEPTTPTPTASAVAQAPRDRVTVVVRAEGTSWVQATTGSGRLLFEGLLADRSKTLTAKARVRLVVGNAGAVSLTVNGQDVGSPGAAGQVARVEFTRDDPAAG